MTENPSILLVATSLTGVASLRARLQRWACEIHFASSSMDAIGLVRNRPFDLLVSEFRLRGGSSAPLAASLIGSNATLVYSYPVEKCCWWLPAVMNGSCCWGSPGMRPREFIHFLEDFLSLIRLRRTVRSDESSGKLFELLPGTALEENAQRLRKESSATKNSADAA